MDDHLDIPSVLAISEQQESIIAAQQQVTQQVMNNNQLLRDALQQTYSEAEQYKELYEKEQAKNLRLQKENEVLRSRPMQVAGDFIENQQIDKYLAIQSPQAPRPKRTKKVKPSADSNNQLTLWKNTETFT